ncbi:MAG: hypothetical protein GQ570_06300 [Helicobacteraceae bacterium]|nr:hypothetical protein [Helicobacteraceae bacterium]
MHSITLNIQEEVYSQFMGMLQLMPHRLIEIEKDETILKYKSVTMTQAQENVSKAIEGITKTSSAPLDKAFEIIMATK